jgi:hypothetical protein
MHRQAINQDELQMRAFWRQWHADMQGIARKEVHEGPLPSAGSEPVLHGARA